MQQNNGQKQQETVLPSFHSLISTLGVSNDSTLPSININTSTWDRQQPSTSCINPSLPSLQSSLEQTTLECNYNNGNIGTCIIDSPSVSFPTCPFNYHSTQDSQLSSPFPPHYCHNPFTPLYNSSHNQTQYQHVTPIISATSLLLSPTSPPQQQYLTTQNNTLLSSPSNMNQQPQLNNSPIRSRRRNNSPPITPNTDALIESQQNKKEKKKQIKFMPNNNFKSLNSSSQPQLPRPPSVDADDVEVTNVTFSMEKQSQPKKKRKGIFQSKNSKLSPIVNQSESTNDSDYSSTGSYPFQNGTTNGPSISTDNSSQNVSNPTQSNNIMNSGLFMEFIGTSTKKRKQYRDIINYKDEFFTDSYSAEKRLRESSTKYRSKQPLNPNNKEK
ncbi:predicted protein [Naegleria gruberi]|uniref:Predicted protein n=1 Tax=Naegleria gruberi TaxID=5762 RepID=D2V525_NAEGR|nr:uncharacterized protein NAEGRDRAFT_46771 [Naegleria gruberi]EFC48032.1 predicted protein [Naegleria gruberi]|eukprot:XP_002680776.1 predicted protein [Naegleria gruberi strain NEG-M]